MVKFIHSGDIHLGLKFKNVSFGGEKGKTRRLELWQSFRRFISYGIEEEVDLILLAGDIFESDFITISDIKRFSDILAMAKNQEICIIAGNHDSLGSHSIYGRLDFSQNVHIFNSDGLDEKFFSNLNTKVYGLSWGKLTSASMSILDEINKEEDCKKILMVHGDIKGDDKYLPLDINKLKSLKLDYIALGHIHKPELFSNNMAYCGSLEPLDFGETGPRGFIKGVMEEETKIEFVPFSLREFIIVNIEVKDDETYEQIYNRVLDETHKGRDTNFYRVNISGSLPLDIDKTILKDDLSSKFYHLELKYNTRSIDLEKIKLENKGNIVNRFIDSFSKEELEDPVFYDALITGIHALLEGGK